MKVLVCGGRNYRDVNKVWDTLDAIGISELCHGGSIGADLLSGCWAWEKHVPVKIYRADWDKHGKAAGPIRNAEMLEDFKPDLVVAFPGGRGTADMVRRSKTASVPTMEIPE